LTAEEAIEEILEVVGALLAAVVLIVVALILLVGRPRPLESLGSVSVLMFTTAGPTNLAMRTKSLGGSLELTTVSGVASSLLPCRADPRTPCRTKEAVTMTAEKAANKINAVSRRCARSHSKIRFIELNRPRKARNHRAGVEMVPFLV